MKETKPRIKTSKTMELRKKYLKKGIELINITSLCEVKLGTSGWCNDLNEPEETIHHIQIHYRDEVIANVDGNGISIIDEKYMSVSVEEGDFIIYRKVNKGGD